MKKRRALKMISKIKRNLRKLFFLPVPGTAPLSFYILRFLPSPESCKRIIATAMVFIYTGTQVLFAQNVIAALPQGALPHLYQNLKFRAGSWMRSGKILFNAAPFGFDYQKQDRDHGGFLSPHGVMQKEKEQLDRMETAQALQ